MEDTMNTPSHWKNDSLEDNIINTKDPMMEKLKEIKQEKIKVKSKKVYRLFGLIHNIKNAVHKIFHRKPMMMRRPPPPPPRRPRPRPPPPPIVYTTTTTTTTFISVAAPSPHDPGINTNAGGELSYNQQSNQGFNPIYYDKKNKFNQLGGTRSGIFKSWSSQRSQRQHGSYLDDPAY